MSAYNQRNRQYTEDSKADYTKEDVKKAFLHLSKDRFSTVQKEDIVYFWEDMADFENQVMTVRVFDGRNYIEAKKAFGKVKKECYASHHCINNQVISCHQRHTLISPLEGLCHKIVLFNKPLDACLQFLN